MSRSRFPKKRRGYAPFASPSNHKKVLLWSVSLGWFLAVCALVWGLLFVSDAVTLGGVPSAVVGRFVQDPPSLFAFLTGDKNTLHQRLQELGIEEQIKDYYRDRFPDEVQLDQYIHQVLYNWTGYVGDNYLVNSQGILVLKTAGEIRLRREIQENNHNILPLPQSSF